MTTKNDGWEESNMGCGGERSENTVRQVRRKGGKAINGRGGGGNRTTLEKNETIQQTTQKRRAVKEGNPKKKGD